MDSWLISSSASSDWSSSFPSWVMRWGMVSAESRHWSWGGEATLEVPFGKQAYIASWNASLRGVSRDSSCCLEIVSRVMLHLHGLQHAWSTCMGVGRTDLWKYERIVDAKAGESSWMSVMSLAPLAKARSNTTKTSILCQELPKVNARRITTTYAPPLKNLETWKAAFNDLNIQAHSSYCTPLVIIGTVKNCYKTQVSWETFANCFWTCSELVWIVDVNWPVGWPVTGQTS
jgi:hypothetical protein